jgi:predicted alpha/beta hydrolase family esterase
MEDILRMIVIVYGYDGSGPGHWQRWLEAELRSRGTPVVFPELPNPTAPCKDAWVAALVDTVEAARGAPVTFVCHSLGCWAVDHLLAERGSRGVHAALLVAPPSPYLLFEPVESFLPPPRQASAWAPLAARTLIVGSDNDDFTSAEEFAEIAGALGVGCQLIAGAGHINLAAGYGPWPFVIDWLQSVGAL